MATLEDKILGEKLHNYCSSSEESDDQNSDSEDSDKPKAPEQDPAPLPEPNKWEGTSSNTGPKGVLADWKKFKRQEKEEREGKPLALEDLEKEAIDADLADLLKEEDQYLLNYQKKRMAEMLEQSKKNKFGQLYYLKDGQEYLEAIDKDKSVIVIIHIYEEALKSCRIMNYCLSELCKTYDTVKFCAIASSKAGVSVHFKNDGIPALLVYKSGNLIGNFVRVSDDLGPDFHPEDVQGFLVEHGLIEDKSCVPALVRGPDESDSDSD